MGAYLMADMISGDTFRSMVDEALKAVSVVSDPLQFRSLEDTNNSIAACFTLDVPLREQAKLWKQELIFRHERFGDVLTPYLEVASSLWDASFNPGTGPASVADWRRAIELILENQNWMPHFRSTPIELLKLTEQHSIALAQASKQLSFLGENLHMVDGQPVFTIEAPGKLRNEIDALCRQMGGKYMFARILFEINGKYDSRLRRYHLVREVAQALHQPPTPQVPWGYLIQLGVKHFSSVPPTLEPVDQWNQLVALLTASTALFDLQPYSVFDNLFVKKESIIQDLS